MPPNYTTEEEEDVDEDVVEFAVSARRRAESNTVGNMGEGEEEEQWTSGECCHITSEWRSTTINTTFSPISSLHVTSLFSFPDGDAAAKA